MVRILQRVTRSGGNMTLNDKEHGCRWCSCPEGLKGEGRKPGTIQAVLQGQARCLLLGQQAVLLQSCFCHNS